MAGLDYFTVTCNGVGAIGIDYIDASTDPDEDIVYAFVEFRPRLEPGKVVWAPGLTPPRGIQLDKVKARFAPEDGKLRTIIASPVNERQQITVTGTPSGGTFTLTYAGQTTAGIPYNASPSTVQAALEALSNVEAGDVYVWGNAQNERQTVTVNGSPAGGTFCLTFDGEETDPISRQATAPTVKTALQSLPNIGGAGCSVSGPPGGPWLVDFTGSNAGVNVTQMTAGPRSEIQTLTITATGGDYRLAFSGQTTTTLAWDASAATIQAALEALSNIAPGDVTVTGSNPFNVAWAGAWANQDVPQLLPVYQNEVQTVTITGSPTTGNFTLTFDGQTTTPIPRNSSATTVRQRLEALANVGPGNVTVTGNTGGLFFGAGGPYTVTFKNALGNRNLPQMSASHNFGGGTAPNIGVTTTLTGIGLLGDTPKIHVATAQKHAALLGGVSPTVTVSTTQTGSTGSPYVVLFTGTLAATDVAQMTANGASLTPSGGVTVETVVTGTSDLGVKLVANTAVINLPELIYDVVFTIPESNRILNQFAILAPTAANQVIDLASVQKLPPKDA